MENFSLFCRFKKSQLLAKEWALSTCKLPLWGLPRKSGKVIDRPDMTSAVYCGRKITNQTKHSEDAEEMAHRLDPDQIKSSLF